MVPASIDHAVSLRGEWRPRSGLLAVVYTDQRMAQPSRRMLPNNRLLPRSTVPPLVTSRMMPLNDSRMPANITRLMRSTPRIYPRIATQMGDVASSREALAGVERATPFANIAWYTVWPVRPSRTKGTMSRPGTRSSDRSPVARACQASTPIVTRVAREKRTALYASGAI